MSSLKTIIADDHPIFLKGLENLLTYNNSQSLEVLRSCESGRGVLQALNQWKCDLLILDLSLQDMDGLEVIKAVRDRSTDVVILVLSRFKDAKMVKSAIQTGADGYLLKTSKPEEIFVAIKNVMAGDTYIGSGIKLTEDWQENGFRSFEEKFVKKYFLTKREIQILRLITEAKSNKQIAKELYISDQTVSVHRKNIMRKIGVSNTAGLIKLAYDYCLV